MADSILDTIKKVLGIDSDYTVFDMDIMMHINSAFATLHQLGVGPESGFSIEDNTKTWDAYIMPYSNIESVKSYIYIKVRLLFDPPTTSFAIDSMNVQSKELEWRLNVASEGVNS